MLFGDAHSNLTSSAASILRSDPGWMVPEHWRVELVSVVRGLLLGGRIDEARARRAILWLKQASVLIEDSREHLQRMWQLRNNVSAYDAAYIAVAEAHGITLVTADQRIARAGVAKCPIHVIR
jgi:predicted nucleic acid-binding protein